MNSHRASAEPNWIRHGYRSDVDGLRAFAVALVLFFHAGIAPFTGGFVGVDVFFVVSGYLITHSVLADLAIGRFSFRTFFIRRACRLLPASFVVILATVAVGILILPKPMLENLGRSAAFAAFSISNMFFWRDVGYFALANEFKPLLHTWSLGVEEQFYLVFPPLLIAFTVVVQGRTARILWLLVACIATTLAAEWLLMRGSSAAAFYLMPLRAGEFAIGAALAFLPAVAGQSVRGSNVLYVTGLGLILGSATVLTGSSPFPGWRALLPAIGAGMMIYAGAGCTASRALRSPVAVGLGQMSYSIYLVHWPLMVFAEFLAVYPLSLGDRLMLVGASLALAYPLYAYIERPFRIVGSGSLPANVPTRVTGIMAGCAACQLAALVAWNGLGHEWRYSPQSLREMMATQTVPGGECAAQFVSRDPERRRCVTPDVLRGTAVVLGDSHAEHWRPALAAALPQLGYALDFHGGCIPLPGVRKFMDGREDEACTDYVAGIERIAGAYDVVILAARWSLYSETTVGAYEKGTMARTYVLTDESGSPLTPESAKAVFSRRLEHFVSSLTARGKKVFLLGQAPELGIDLTPCLGRPDWRGMLPARSCKPFYDRAAALARLAFTDAELKRVSAGRSRVALFLPSARLCPAGQEYCDVLKDGHWLYRDDDHLNAQGAMTFVPEMLAALRPLVDADLVATSALAWRP